MTEAPDRAAEARDVLDANWTGHSTIPAPGLYPHQWNWDTGFIAIGRSHSDQPRAETEMRHLFDAQWANGMLPHIVFNPDVAADAYFPGPDFWRSETSPDAPKGVRTSGITQPPIHSWAVFEMFRNAPDTDRSRAFLKEMFPRLVKLHDYLREHRSADDGVAWFVHPWESGLDNSPAWDTAFERVDVPEGKLPPFQRADLKHGDARDRPTDEDYDRFVYLAVAYRDIGYDDARALDEVPFRIYDPMFNAIWARSAVALSQIAHIIGEDGKRFSEDADRTTRGIEKRMWDASASRFVPIDALTSAAQNHHSIVSMMPIVAPGLRMEYAGPMHHALRGFMHEYHGEAYICPSYAIREAGFSKRRYWRGPIWINTNWLLYEGAIQHGGHLAATHLRRAVLELVESFGFREYYDPYGKEAYGADRFSWSAALYLDLLSKDPETSS